jgi:hypothetical protein
VSDLDQLRAEAAAARGLDPAAARLLTGTTIAEVEESADELARLVGQHEQADADQPEQPGSDFFARAAADKQRRRSELLDALTGRPRPERDQRGRFASGGFDGGARQSLPAQPETHEQTLTRILASREADVGRRI